MKILVVEDNPIEQMKIKRVMNSLGNNGQDMKMADNAEKALEALDSDAYNPNIILLDLNMPGMGGLEFLKLFKKGHSKAHIPIIIFSTSKYSEEIKDCYFHGASAYFVKPMNFITYKELLRRLLAYWSTNEFVPVPV